MKDQSTAADGARGSAAVSASAVVVGSLGLAGLQYLIARRGMQSADEVHGLDGIGVAAGYLVGELSVSLVLLLIATRALGIKHWVLAALAVAAGDFALVTFLFQYLHGDDQRRWSAAAAFAASLLPPAFIAWRTTWAPPTDR